MLRPGTSATASGRGTLGSLESLALPEIVQSLTMGRKTARISLTSDGRWGHIWIEQGRATHARTRSAVGELAFYEMVGWGSGRFLIEPDVRTDTRSLDHDPMYLVMEGCRRLDESAESSDPVGPESALSAAPIPLDRSAAAGPAAPVSTSPAAGAGPVSRRNGPPGPRHPRRRILLPLLSILAAELILFVPARALLERAAMSVGTTAPPTIASPAPAAGISEAPGHGTPEPAEQIGDRRDENATGPEAPEGEAAPDPGPPDTSVARAPAAKSRRTPLRREGPVEAASVGPDVAPGDRPHVAQARAEEKPAPAATFEAFVRLAAESRVRGELTVLVDGREVYTRELGDGGSRLGIFGKKGETFETVIAIPAGRRELEARVASDGEPERFEDSVVLSLEPGTTREIRLVAGRKRGREISLAVSELVSTSAREID